LISGQGTVGLELLEQEPDLEVIVVPVGGGSLIAGIATAVKHLAPHVEIIGVEAASYPTTQRSLAASHIEACGDTATLADGIAVRQVGELPFAQMQKFVDRIVTVTEEEIASSILALVEQEKTVAEGAGAVALAAALEKRFDLRGRRTACIVSGGNIDVNTLSKIIERGLSRDGRRVRLSIDVPDRPGSLTRVSAVIAACRGNILEVHHERAFASGPVGMTAMRFTLETRGREHVEEVIEQLNKDGFTAREERREI
jgi:threonine dehydratase